MLKLNVTIGDTDCPEMMKQYYQDVNAPIRIAIAQRKLGEVEAVLDYMMRDNDLQKSDLITLHEGLKELREVIEG